MPVVRWLQCIGMDHLNRQQVLVLVMLALVHYRNIFYPSFLCLVRLLSQLFDFFEWNIDDADYMRNVAAQPCTNVEGGEGFLWFTTRLQGLPDPRYLVEETMGFVYSPTTNTIITLQETDLMNDTFDKVFRKLMNSSGTD